MEHILLLWTSSGLANVSAGQAIMLVVCLVMLYLAIVKEFEPLLLLPIGFGGFLANIPEAGMALTAMENAIHAFNPELMQMLAAKMGIVIDTAHKAIGQEQLTEAFKALTASKVPSDNLLRSELILMAEGAGYSDGILQVFFKGAIETGAAPLIIFLGVGAMTDFGPLLANPKTLFLGAAAQFGIFTTLLGAVALSHFGIVEFSIQQAAAIGIIGGADGPTSIYVTSILAPELLGAIAVAAYSYMALVPLIQPPIMRALTTKEERGIVMQQQRPVSQREKIIFPIAVLTLVALLLPDAAPLLGMFCLGNLMRECGVVNRLSDTAQNALINITTIFLGLAVGAKLVAHMFLNTQTLGILALGIVAFGVGTAAGVIMAKLMNLISKEKINPLIGSAGVSAVPMAARVSNKVGLETNPQNFLLMHAMGPNVGGVIGSAIAAGVMISYLA